ncbi:MAG TPA: hypothetical protein VFS97_05230 [Nitrososphaeraceae archaeon]|nr:hypothetical protein [Nitrososphaeraceae archaeon]
MKKKLESWLYFVEEDAKKLQRLIFVRKGRPGLGGNDTIEIT